MPGPAALIDPDGLTLPWAGAAQPYGLVDLDRAPRSDAPLHLPPFPLLGIGDSTHPLALRLDALIELPVSLAAIVQQIVAQPEAARVLVQLLRLIDGLDAAQALVALVIVALSAEVIASVTEPRVKTAVRDWVMRLSAPNAKPWSVPKCPCANWPHKPMAKR